MRGLVVGRFQPLHRGHLALIKQAIEDSVHVTVVVGSASDSNTLRNPFSFEERERMLRAALGDTVDILGVPDIHDPPRYADYVVNLVGSVDKIFGNEDRTLDLFEDAGYPVGRTGLTDRDSLQGKTVRAWLAEGDSAWRKAVGPAVAAVLDDINAPARLAQLE